MHAVATSEARSSEFLRHPIPQSLKRNNRKIPSHHIVIIQMLWSYTIYANIIFYFSGRWYVFLIAVVPDAQISLSGLSRRETHT